MMEHDSYLATGFRDVGHNSDIGKFKPVLEECIDLDSNRSMRMLSAAYHDYLDRPVGHFPSHGLKVIPLGPA